MNETKEAKEIQAIVTTGILNYLENTKFNTLRLISKC
jgi:hypothetical protein